MVSVVKPIYSNIVIFGVFSKYNAKRCATLYGVSFTLVKLPFLILTALLVT
jgi:hypothetical protein